MPRKSALITGASAGLGVAFAHAYARRGFDVILVARRTERLENLATILQQKYSITAHVITQDLSEVDAHKTILKNLKAYGLVPNVLVNNAGFSIPQKFANTTWEQQQNFIMTLVLSVTALTHAVLPDMIARGSGQIINVSSMIAWSPGAPGHTLYPAAKSFILRFSQSLATEVEPHGITVTTTCPGSTETEFTQANNTTEIMKDLPKNLMQTAEEVVAGTIKACDRGQTVYIPGFHNKVSVAMMRYLPDVISGPLMRKMAEKYSLEK